MSAEKKRQAELQDGIQSVVNVMMERVLNKVLYTDPFLSDKFKAEKPLYAALVPEEIFKGSHFERRFVTPFGSAWEQLAIVAAKHGLGRAESGYIIHGQIHGDRLKRITEVLNRLEHGKTNTGRIRPDWNAELEYIRAARGKQLPISIVCDIHVENPDDGKKYSFEIKGPLHNSDQAKVSKEKLLKIHAMEPKPVDEAYFCLPYNPYGKRSLYTWSHPARWFDMKNDAVVLIGDEFWNKIGGDGTYQGFIAAINQIGKAYRDRIYREYLGMEPPARDAEIKL
jgi:hypothetical protein